MKLLLVEDEQLLSKSIAKGLKMLGYAVDCAYDGEEALYLYEVNTYDLMILDLNLPILDGMEVLRRIRQHNTEFRILILSARNSLDDKINGLDMGSNDYLTKPFEFKELEARIRSLLRRSFSTAPSKVMCGALMLDMTAHKVFCHDTALELTRKEYALLEYLINHPGQIISAEELIEHAWESENDLFSNTFRFHIHSLRRKLEQSMAGVHIVTKRGLGYCLEATGI